MIMGMRQQLYSNLLNYLRSLLGLLELDRDTEIYQDAIAVCNFLEHPTYRIAVFGPFNHGKSTLLNALLGKKTLPIDLIPTTGAAISVCYGDELTTQISFQDGKQIEQSGTKILQEYAILDGDRRMRADVTGVKVFCNHPWLKTGVELLDLPGTNDRESQDNLVKDRLLSADLIVHVLDARKLMTLEERENLQGWLQDRGINTVIFVVNFLNLLTPEERIEVRDRLRFVAESFRSQLPPGVSNLYCVDALPALRARLKGDTCAAQTTGLAIFESALQHIVESQADRADFRLSRVVILAQKLWQLGTEKRQASADFLTAEQQKQEQQIAVKQKAAKLIQQGFTRSSSEFQGWLYLPKLLTRYQAELAIALQQENFTTWHQSEFQPTVVKYQQAINSWIDKSSEFFKLNNLDKLLIDFPHHPEIKIVEPQAGDRHNSQSNNKSSATIPAQLNPILKGKVGRVILGGASYVLHKVAPDSESKANLDTPPPPKISSQAYADAAQNYLTQFSDRAFAALKAYEIVFNQSLSFSPQPINHQITNLESQLRLLDNLLLNLKTELNNY